MLAECFELPVIQPAVNSEFCEIFTDMKEHWKVHATENSRPTEVNEADGVMMVMCINEVLMLRIQSNNVPSMNICHEFSEAFHSVFSRPVNG